MPFPDTLMTPPPVLPPDPFFLPTQFVQGDTLKYKIQNAKPHASADGWYHTLQLRLQNAQAAINITSSIDTDGNFVLTAASNVTSGWTVGRYDVLVFAVNTDGRQETTIQAFLDVTPKLSLLTNSTDNRSHARRCLDLIEALLEGRALTDIVQSTIDNTHFTRMNFTELCKARTYYKAEVRQEARRARAKAGLASGNLILTRFVVPN